MQRYIVIIATLDTKGTEAAFLKSFIEKAGHRALVIDAGVLGQPPLAPNVKPTFNTSPNSIQV